MCLGIPGKVLETFDRDGLPMGRVEFGGIVKDPWGGMRTGFSITMKLDRKDYGISFNKVLDQGGTLLGDEVEISIELEAVKKA